MTMIHYREEEGTLSTNIPVKYMNLIDFCSLYSFTLAITLEDVGFNVQHFSCCEKLRAI
jgi:hypothetical protein